MDDWSLCPVCREPTTTLWLRLAVAFRRQRCPSCGGVLRGRADALGWRIAAAALLLVCLVLLVTRVIPQAVGWLGVIAAGGLALVPELVFPLRPDLGDPITGRALRRAEIAREGLEPPVSIEEHRERTGR